MVGFVTRRPRTSLPPAAPREPQLGDEAAPPGDDLTRTVAVVDSPLLGDASGLEVPEPTSGRLTRLRGRLSRSSSTLGRGLFALLSRDQLDDSTWEEVEDTLLTS